MLRPHRDFEQLAIDTRRHRYRGRSIASIVRGSRSLLRLRRDLLRAVLLRARRVMLLRAREHLVVRRRLPFESSAAHNLCASDDRQIRPTSKSGADPDDRRNEFRRDRNFTLRNSALRQIGVSDGNRAPSLRFAVRILIMSGPCLSLIE